MKKIYFLLICMFTGHCLLAQAGTVQQYVKDHTQPILKQFMELLSVPNIAADTANILRNANMLADDMKQRGIRNVQLLYAQNNTSNPAVYGEYLTPGVNTTIIFYAHYDGQPVSPAKWHPRLQPFTPVMLNGKVENNAAVIPADQYHQITSNPQARIYARSASDDKAGVMAILNAFSAILKTGKQPGINLKFFFEGEEEAGSPHLESILNKHQQLLQSDAWIICDGPVHQTGLKQLVFGVRGDVNMEITVYGPKRPLHSGHYGNWVPNPAMQLTRLLASMKNDSGFVTINGFYDDVLPLSKAEKEAIAQIPSIDSLMMRELGILKPEMEGINLYQSAHLPSLNINGIESGRTGAAAANVIPVSASAVLDIRLVKGDDWQKQAEKVKRHITGQGFFVTEQEPDDQMRSRYPRIAKVHTKAGYNAQKTDMELPVMKKITAVLQQVTGNQLVIQPGLGGSLPLYLFEKILHAYPVTFPIANHDNNQHGENENILVSNFLSGIAVFAELMLMKID